VRQARSLGESFRFAFAGLWYALRTQRNMRLHMLTATVVVALGTVLRLPRRDFISVLTAIMVVMVAEMVNTAVEATVDVATGEYHPLAKVAKDVAAGAVLLASAGAFALGVWVFVPRLSRVPAAVAFWRTHHPWGLGFLGLAVAAVAVLAWVAPKAAREEDRLH
jgi:diacylglycerol kinase